MGCLYRSVKYYVDMTRKISTGAKKPAKHATRKTGQDTRARLMQTMLNLIWSQSYNGVSVEDICKAAGAQKGSFYHFFPSKAALAYEVFKSEWEQCRSELDEIFSPTRPALERFRLLGEAILEEQAEKYKELGYVCGCPFATIGSELATQDEQMRTQVEGVFACHMRYFVSAVRDGVAEGVLPADTDVEAKAKEIDNYMLGSMLVARIRNSLLPIEQAFAAGIYHLLGVKPPKPARKPSRKAA